MYAYSEQIERQDGRDWTPAYNPEFVAKVHAKRRQEKIALEKRLAAERHARIEAAAAEEKKRVRTLLDHERQLRDEREKERELLTQSEAEAAALEQAKGRPSVLRYCELEALKHGTTLRAVRDDKSRRLSVMVVKRSIIAAIYSEFPDLSLSRIARIFDIDRTSVLNHVKKAGVWRNPGRPGENNS